MTTGRINQVTTELFSLSLFPFPARPSPACRDRRTETREKEKKKKEKKPSCSPPTGLVQPSFLFWSRSALPPHGSRGKKPLFFPLQILTATDLHAWAGPTGRTLAAECSPPTSQVDERHGDRTAARLGQRCNHPDRQKKINWSAHSRPDDRRTSLPTDEQATKIGTGRSKS